MKKNTLLFILPLVLACFMQSKADNINVIRDLQHESLTVPQRVCEREQARLKACEEAAGHTTCAGISGGALGAGLFLFSNDLVIKNNYLKTLAATIGGCAATIYLLKDKIYTQVFESYKNYSPMNDSLQKLLQQSHTKNHNLIDTITTIESIDAFTKTITIEFATKTRPILSTHVELLSLLSYLEEVEKNFKTILREHENLPCRTFTTVETYLQKINKTKQLLKKVIAKIKSTQIFKEQMIEKQKEDLYKAELARIQNAAAAASAKAEKDKAQAQQAKADAELSYLHWWQDVLNGGHNTINVNHRYR